MPTAVDYDALEVIGQGSFGSIRKVRRKSDGVIMARKEIKYEKMEQKERDQLTSEFSILSALRHPNIVEYHHREHVKEHQMVYIYMEYCSNGDLSKVLRDLRKKSKSLREDLVWTIFVQLVYALYRCHYGVDPPENPPNTRNQAPPAHARGNTVIHRDLKPENVFIDEGGCVKLGDFGLSKMLGSEHQMAMTYVGTPLYMSPELVSDTPYTIKTDIWSLGCIVYELCTLKPPFTAKTPHQLFNTIKQGKFDPIPGSYSAELRSVIEQCLRCDPKERPETAQLLFMPAMQFPRQSRELILLKRHLKDLKGKESILNTREAHVAVKERQIGNADARLMAKGQELMAKEQELMAKEQELMAKEQELMAKEQDLRNKEQEMKLYLEERSHGIREQLNMEIRNEWRMKAEVEISQQLEQLKKDLEPQFEFEVKQRVEAQVQQRVDMELRKIMLVPAHTLPLHSTHSFSTSSQLSAETGITSVSSSFHSPVRHNSSQLSAPDSPADIDMYSPSRDQSPFKRDDVFDKPSEHQSSRPKTLFEHRLSDPNLLSNTSMQDPGDGLGDDEEYDSRLQNTTPQEFKKVGPTGSPFKQASDGPIRRSQRTNSGDLSLLSSSCTAPNPDELNMAKAVMAKSLDQKENQPWGGRLINKPAQLREGKQKRTDTVATWDHRIEEMPSPFVSKTRISY